MSENWVQLVIALKALGFERGKSFSCKTLEKSLKSLILLLSCTYCFPRESQKGSDADWEWVCEMRYKRNPFCDSIISFVSM